MDQITKGLSAQFSEKVRDKKTWIFDLDNTLYHSSINLFAQIDQKMGEYIAGILDTSREEARKVQKGYLVKYGTSLAGLMQHHKVDPHHFLEFVHDIDFSPITKDDRLERALSALDGRKIIFTNADVTYTNEVIKRLGVAHHFDDIFDILAADLRPKPQAPTYGKFIREHDIDPHDAVYFEDMAINLGPAHEMGMSCVWVNTGSEWGNPAAGADYVHHEIDCLSTWLHHHVTNK